MTWHFMGLPAFYLLYSTYEICTAVHTQIDIFYLFDASSPAPVLSANFQPFMAESQPTFSHLWLKVTNDFQLAESHVTFSQLSAISKNLSLMTFFEKPNAFGSWKQRTHESFCEWRPTHVGVIWETIQRNARLVQQFLEGYDGLRVCCCCTYGYCSAQYAKNVTVFLVLRLECNNNDALP